MGTTPASVPASSLAARPSVQLLARPEVRGGLLGDRPLLDTLALQPHFAIEGSGPVSSRSIVPQTPAAAALLEGPAGRRFERVLRGTLSSVDGRAGVELRGITLATDEAGFVLNSALGLLDADQRAHGTSADPRAQVRRALDQGRTDTDDSSANHQNGIINLDPEVSSTFTQLGRDPERVDPTAAAFAQYVLGHELEHAITPRMPKDNPHPWIEEAGAELMSLRNKTIAHRAAAAGLAVPHVDGELKAEWVGPAYMPHVLNLQQLLRAGGMDVKDDAGFARAQQILQETPAEQVPARLGAEIARHNGMPSAAREIGMLVEGVGSGRVTVDEIVGLVEQARLAPAAG